MYLLEVVEGGSKMTAFLATCTEVLTWLLSSVTSLITTILATPMLAIGVVLFVVFSVVTFYHRLKG